MARLIGRRSLGPRGDRFDESITLPRHRLNVSRARALVAKDCSEAVDDYVKTVMKVDVPVGPQPALDLFTSNQLAGSLEQQTEQIDRLSAEPQRLPSSPQAPSAIVKLEVSERLHHGRTPF
ncbi:MAG: hypothetical protein AUH72_05805 [Acidobacteria bacterium 13_1_40CM_4_65_8]|nr:MAG: hypothetical protein AUH72_05805 [Acidobacteria bacterium 13_1_40CM_4_65_8]